MCGIAGFFNPEMDFTKEKVYNLNILDAMNQAQKRRGPDDEGTFLNEHFGLAQVRLAIVDLLTGHQPMLHRSGSRTFGIVYNGELYNTKELRDELKTEGAAFDTDSDTEVLLNAYLAQIAETREESTPPDKKVQMGTSETICLFTASRRRKPVFSTVSSKESVCGRLFSFQ